MASKFENSLESGNHFELAKMAGSWTGLTQTWFGPGDPVDTSTWRGTIRSILGGRFMLHEYTGMMMGEALSGIAIIGHHIKDGKFQSAWADSFHMGTGIMLSEGSGEGKLFEALGHYTGSGPGDVWGWRTEMQMPDNDTLIITMYNITPEGEATKAVETHYKRDQMA